MMSLVKTTLLVYHCWMQCGTEYLIPKLKCKEFPDTTDNVAFIKVTCDSCHS